MCTDVVGCHCPGRSEGNRTSKNPPLPLAWTVETIEPRNVNKTQTQNKHTWNHDSLAIFFQNLKIHAKTYMEDIEYFCQIRILSPLAVWLLIFKQGSPNSAKSHTLNQTT